jgi:hypothetical protein
MGESKDRDQPASADEPGEQKFGPIDPPTLSLREENAMSNPFIKTCKMKQLGRLLPIGVTILVCFSNPVFGQPPYWNTTGTVNHVLQNNKFDFSQMINEVDFLTNQNTRIRIHANGQVQVNPVSGTIVGTSGQMQYATMQVQGGYTSSFAGYTAQPGDWGQNIQSYVTRANTVSYVVNWNGTDRFYVAGQGWLYANGAWFNSDLNLKTSVRKIEKPLEKVMKLEGVTFQWKEESPCSECTKETYVKLERRTEMGLVAQDVEKVVPEVVRTTHDGKKALAYQNLVALLIESIKVQQGQLDNQAREINLLQAQVKELQGKKTPGGM